MRGLKFMSVAALGAMLTSGLTVSANAAQVETLAPLVKAPKCVRALPARPDSMRFRKAPSIAKKLPTQWHLQTNCGVLTIDLKPDAAPETVNSIRFLSKRGFFDRTSCHRLTTDGIFVLQCGDPGGDGTGGPGYTIPDENLPADAANNYPAGTVAMANAGPGTGGSQFFIVYKDTTLPSSYTVFGQISPGGLKKIRSIARAGVEDGSDGKPRQAVTLTHAWTSQALKR